MMTTEQFKATLILMGFYTKRKEQVNHLIQVFVLGHVTVQVKHPGDVFIYSPNHNYPLYPDPTYERSMKILQRLFDGDIEL